MVNDRKPDNVVFNSESQTYDSALKSYATNVGAPVITPTDTLAWKNRNINKVNHKIRARYEELKSEYEQLIEEFQYNQLLYSAKFSFEPVIGETYHLYQRKNGEVFLSMVTPNQWNLHFLGSFYLNAEQIWQKVTNQ